MTVGSVKTTPVQMNAEKKELKKTEEKTIDNQKKANSNDKDVKYEKAETVEKDKTLNDYSKQAAVKYAVNIGVVEEMKKSMDQKMEKSFLQMAIDALGEHQVGIKNALEKILAGKGEEITDEMIEQAKEDVAEDGYFGVEATANRMVDFAKAISGGNPEKVELLKNAFLDAFDQAAEAWGDELPEISQKTKDRTLELFDEWQNAPDEKGEAVSPIEVKSE